MTDAELKRLQAICEAANVDDIEDVSDGFHTFNDLYEQRMYLFAALVNAYKDRAWKSLRHEDGEMCFGGDWFIVGIDTPQGTYTYHYGIRYWDVFDCQVLKTAKHWDGHTEKDVTRLLSLPSTQPETHDKRTETHARDLISRQAAIDAADRADCTELAIKDVKKVTDEVIKELKQLPSAQPEQTDCEYCHEDSDWYVRPIEKNSHAVIFGSVLYLKVKGWSGKVQIKFCPMCGRRL